jgi:TMEM175 potassium channel family protein
MFKVIERTNHPFLMLNVLFLMAVSFIPFPTQLVAEHIGDADERTVATIVYGGSMVLIAVMFNLVWGYAAAGDRLLVGGLDPVALQKGTRSYRMGPVVYGVATLIAIADPYVSLAIFAALAIYWIFPSSGPGG